MNQEEKQKKDHDLIRTESDFSPLNKQRKKTDSHLILDLTGLNVVSLLLDVDLVVDHNVEISRVDAVGLAVERTFDLLAFGDGDRVGGVEHGLLPVGVLKENRNQPLAFREETEKGGEMDEPWREVRWRT